MQVEIFSDGSATVKTKPGGYGYVVLIDGKVEETGSGNSPAATNNDMELEGAIAGLTAAKKIIYNNPRHFDAMSTVTLVSDSQIVLGWVTGEYRFKQEDKMERYIELQKLVNQLRVTTRWVEGHSGDQYNEECDRLANAARKALLPPEEVKPKKERKKKQLSPPEGQLSPPARNNSNLFKWNIQPPPPPPVEEWVPHLNKFVPKQQDARTDKEKLMASIGLPYPDTNLILRILAELVEIEEKRNAT